MKRVIYLLICCCFFSFCKAQKEESIKIMSCNIGHGEGLDSILDISRAANIIKTQAPDLCGLQEIDNFCTRSKSIYQTKVLAKKTNMKGTFGKFMDFQGGAYGMATLSAKPIISTKILQLPDGKHEPRSSIVQEIQIAKNHTVIFANVHFDWIDGKEGSENRLNQAKALVNYIDKLNKAVIITGDFNCKPNSPTMNYFSNQGFIFIKKGDDNLSFQGDEKVEIDHLIYRNSKKVKFKKKNIELLKEPVVSDHRPLIVELSIFLQ